MTSADSLTTNAVEISAKETSTAFFQVCPMKEFGSSPQKTLHQQDTPIFGVLTLACITDCQKIIQKAVLRQVRQVRQVYY